MEIEKLRVMRGPNYWSTERHQLIVVQINADPAQAGQFNEIKGRVSVPLPGAKYSASATDMMELCAGLALDLQRAAGMECDFMYLPQEGRHEFIFSYSIEAAGVYAGRAAVRILNSAIQGNETDISADLDALRQLRRRNSMGPSTQAIADEARARNIPVARINSSSLTRLGQGKNIRLFQAAVTGGTSVIASDIAKNKSTTKDILKAANISIPEGYVVSNAADLPSALSKLGYPVAVKPLNGNHGRGITTNIQSYEAVAEALTAAQEISREVIIERHIEGLDHRFLVINFKLVAVARRVPASVTGNGRSSIGELVDLVNADPRRGDGHENMLTRIKIDDQSLDMLSELGYSLETVVPAGEIVFLKNTANLSTGGTAEDVTDTVHPSNIFLAERIARLLNLDICGIDIMTKDVSEPITARNGAVLEVNSGPGLRMHMAPSSGKPRNVAAPIIDMLYPGNSPSRVPVVAITGTNGKTTTTRLMAHLASEAGFTPGFTSTDGVYIDGHQVNYGDCSGPHSASVVLGDPIVDYAVLECARGGILRAGLGFDGCDIGIVTNISADHMGLGGIDTIEQLARVKAVVPKSTFPSGYAVLNADDELVYQMKEGLNCNLALFSLDGYQPRIRQHIADGLPASYIAEDCFYITAAGEQYMIACVKDVPLTYDGNSECMIKNILPAILGAYLSGISIEDIQLGLMSFIPSFETTPGRMNHLDFARCKVVLDYAHNEGGYVEVKKYLDKIKAPYKIGIISVAGDRRDEDIRMVGEIAAHTFDEIIIRHDSDMRGRCREEVTHLLSEGVRRGTPGKKVHVISDVKEAVRFAMNIIPEKGWIFVNSEDVPSAITFLLDLQKSENLMKAG